MDVMNRINEGMKYTRTQYLRAIIWRFGMSRKEVINTYNEAMENNHITFLDGCVTDYKEHAIMVPIIEKGELK